MDLFLDTAKIDEIRETIKMGLISGVTTNPSLMMQAGRGDYKEVTREICYLVQNRISAEVVSMDPEGMLAEAREIATWSPHVVVKIPTTAAGLQAMHLVSQETVSPEPLCQGCPWFGKCDTDIDTARELASMWGTAGAAFVSPFVGRLDDIDHDGMGMVADIVEVFEYYGIQTQVIAASIRHPLHITQAALAGADIATISYAVLMKALKHPLTDIGVERFLADWDKVK